MISKTGKTLEDLLREDGIGPGKPEDEFYESVEEYDPVLRDHCRLGLVRK